MDHETLFKDYIFDMMCEGVEKQIRDVYGDGDASARLMAAVALMAYTEFMGAVLLQKFDRDGAQDKFDAFLKYMDGPYRDLVYREDFEPYDVFRCGLTHGFFVKGLCTFAMKNNPGPLLVIGDHGDVVIQKPVNVGIGKAENGGFYFVVEKYFLDFKTACLKLFAERRGEPPTYPLPQKPKQSKGPPGDGDRQRDEDWVSSAPVGTTSIGDSG